MCYKDWIIFFICVVEMGNNFVKALREQVILISTITCAMYKIPHFVSLHSE